MIPSDKTQASNTSFVEGIRLFMFWTLLGFCFPMTRNEWPKFTSEQIQGRVVPSLDLHYRSTVYKSGIKNSPKLIHQTQNFAVNRYWVSHTVWLILLKLALKIYAWLSEIVWILNFERNKLGNSKQRIRRLLSIITLLNSSRRHSL